MPLRTSSGRVVRAMTRRGAYEGARGDLRELMGWLPMLGSADQDSLGDIPALRARSSDLERNAPIAGGAIVTRLDNVVGSGLMPTPQIDRLFLGLSEDEASAWHRDARRIFQATAMTTRFDVANRNNFAQMQRLALRTTLSRGDAFAIRRWRPMPGDVLALKVQLLEADRVANPRGEMNRTRLRDGVVLDEYGMALGYWVAKEHPNEFGWGTPQTHYDYVPAIGGKSGQPMVLHIMEQLRVGQTRGVPYLAPVIRQLKQLDRFSDAELAAAVIAAFFTVFIKHADAIPEDGPSLKSLAGEEDLLPDPNAAGDNVTLGHGAVVELPRGRDITIANPNRPNAQFDPFVTAVCSQIGVGLGIPRELLLKQFNSSYSASRAALLEAWRSFEAQQDWLVATFCQPVYEWIITEAVHRGLLQAPGFAEDPLIRRAYLAAVWAGPTVTQLDPLKEVEAAKRRVDEGFSSRALEAQQLTGQDFDLLHEQRVREEKKRSADGLTTAASGAPMTSVAIAADERETPPNEEANSVDR